MKNIIIMSFLFFFLGCKSNKELATVPVVDLEKYKGTWYEIARFNHSFEKNLTCVSATYSIREDGKINVFNKGYNSKKEKWQDAKGLAKVPNISEPGVIKVSFFRPFYGDYYIMKLDENYKHVLVGAPNRKYLWILSRTKTMKEETYKEYIEFAKSKGFETSKLIKIDQDCK